MRGRRSSGHARTFGPPSPVPPRVYPMYIIIEGFNMAGRVVEKVSKIPRWGNSLGVKIPQEGVDQLKLKDGESVNVRVSGNSITIRRAKARKKWREEELLKGTTPAMCGPDLIPDRAGTDLI